MEHFSEQLEISPSTAQDYLKARGNPTVKTIEHLAEKPGLSLCVPMQVTRIRLLYPTGAYPMCPKCGSTMEQEYQDFCVFCSQCLDWAVYQKAVGTHSGGEGGTAVKKSQAGG